MLVVQPVYGLLTSRVRRTVFLPWVYGFFILNLVGFYIWFHVQADHTWIARAFFVWLSVFNLFVVSVFWSLMADLFKPEQAKRLFGFIAAAASLGGLVGPLIAASLARRVGSVNLLLVTMVALAIAIVAVRYLTSWHARQSNLHAGVTGTVVDTNRPLGGKPWAAFSTLLGSRYLLNVAAFVFLLTWISTFLYLEQAKLVSHVFKSPDEQTQVFGTVDAIVQGLSLVAQVFAFSRLAIRWGVRVLLVSVPLLMVGVFAGLALYPTLTALLTGIVVRRIGEYAITRPCREVLFTVVDREVKYKAKNAIDTLVYRVGDALSGSVYAGLGLLGLASGGLMWVGALLAAIWAAVAFSLGKSFEKQRASLDVPAPSCAVTRA
jgi:AAA family ATP:ADP antiporter